MTSMMADYHLDLPKEDIDAVLRTKRKAREPKACYPCHSRKVKCDRKLPCDSCIKRDHADLCTYERPLKRRQLGLPTGTVSGDEYSMPESPTYPRPPAAEDNESAAANYISIPRMNWERMRDDLRSAQETIHQLRIAQGGLGAPMREQQSRVENDTGVHAESDRMGTVHLGSRSVLAYMMGLGRSKSSQEAAKSVLEEDVLPKLGLDNENATYPFVDLWSTDQSTNNVNGLCSTLPDDSLCREFFISYRDVACTIYPVMYDAVGLESTMEQMLQHRARAGGIYIPPVTSGPDKPFGVSISWLGLFFAILASGSQSSNLPSKQRELTSQVYICCAYQALRMTNFMSYPSLEAVQTLLIIANVLAYNMNPGNAYVVLGMALRISFVMGLQTDSSKFSAQETYARRRVWWVLAWQDSHFSISYDRPTAAAFTNPEIPYQTTPGNRTYPEAMFQVIQLTLEVLRLRVLQPRTAMPISTIVEYKERLSRIIADAAPFLRERAECATKVQHVERLAFKLHCGYLTSELCRSAVIGPINGRIKPEFSPPSSPDEEVIASIRQDFITGLRRTITAYLELHTVCSLGTRSWIGIQRAVSAAFLLAIQDEARGDTKIHGLLRSLEEVISERVTFDSDPWAGQDVSSPYGAASSSSGRGSFSGTHTTESPHWAKSMSNSLKALSKLNHVLADRNARSGRAPMPMTSSSVAVYSPDTLGAVPVKPQNPAAMLMHSAPDVGLVTPVTPDSTGSSDWNVANLVERAGQYVQAPLW